MQRSSCFPFPLSRVVVLLLGLLLLHACNEVPEGIQPVKQVDLKRYVGKWYEIVRLDNSFEKGLSQTSATYSFMPDSSGLVVVNSGFKNADNEWRSAKGRAYPMTDPISGHFKVSFFGPFFGSYVIFDLDTIDYQYSMITGGDKSYFWILSRTPTMDRVVLDRLIGKAKSLGFDTQSFLYVNQDSSLSR